MIARVLLALALAASLFALGRGLGDGRASSTSGDRAPRRLVDAARAEALSVAALRVVDGQSGERFDYAQQGGVWRCVNAHGALALSSEVVALAAEVLGAVGEPRAADPARLAEYGLGPDAVTVSLHGPRVFSAPDADRLFALRLGAALPGVGAGRSFAALEGAPQVFELASNPRARLARAAGDRLPPLLDRRVLAGEFPGPGGGVARAFVDWPDGRGLELALRELSPGDLPAGRAPREWVVREDGLEAVALPFRVAGWQSFLFRSGYAGFAAPEDAPRLGFGDGPAVRVTLVLRDGDPVELEVGRRLEGGAAFVANAKTGMLCLVEPAHAALFAPTVEMLTEPARPNPWEAWLAR